MAETKRTKTTRNRPWWRWPAWIGGGLVVLLLIAYFALSSSAFVKGVVLPKVGDSMNAKVTAESVSFSPFSKLELRNLEVTPTGHETLLKAQTVRVRYSLIAIIGGKLAVDEILVESPVITITTYPDGTSNLDPITAQTEPSKPAEPSEPTRVDIKKLSFNNATIRQVTQLKGGGQDVVELNNFTVTANDISNGGSGKFAVTGDIVTTSADRNNQPSSSLDGKLSAGFDFSLTQELTLATLNGNASFLVQNASGNLSDFRAFAANLDCDVTPTEVKQVALRFNKAGETLGEILASGPFDASKTEGTLNIRVLSLDRRVLNLATAATGMDFGTTTINSTNQVSFANSGNQITTIGQLDISRFQVIREGQTTPTLSLRCDYNIVLDGSAESAVLKTLEVVGTQDQRTLLQTHLTSPMTISWGDNGGTVGDSTLDATLNNLNLADWSALAPDLALAGTVNAKLTVRSQQGGTQMALDFSSQLAGVSADLAGTPVRSLGATARGNAALQQDRSWTGEFALTDINGSCGDYQFDRYGVTVNFEAAMSGDQFSLRKTSGELRSGQNAGGKFELAANVDSAKNEGNFNLTLADVNQYGLRPFLQPSLGTNQLVSIKLDSTASGNWSADGDAHVKADMTVANLVVREPQAASPNPPLDGRFQLDAAMKNDVAQVQQCQITLTPTERAKNQLTVSGKLDFSDTNAITGAINIAAESLDLTRYYDLLGQQTGTAAATPTAGAPTTTAPTPPVVEQEPEPLKLPVRDLVFEISIGRLYLREVDAANLRASARVDGGHVVIKPFELTLNEAPVSAAVDLDLGVPGYKYDITFDAQRVPIAPLVNSFEPERKGQLGGTLTASAQIKGAGTTGVNLQKSLTGSFGVLTTNLNLSIEDVRSPLINSIINVVIAIPELITNPGATVSGFLGRLAGASRGGWADQLIAAPVDVIFVNGNAGNGRINLANAEIRSSAFKAEATGDISIAPVLTNSTLNIPLTIYLSRSLAEKIGQVTAETPTNAAYVALPDFVTLTGTVGVPKPKTDPLALVRIAGRAGGGIFNRIGEAGGQTGSSILNRGARVFEGLTGGSRTNQPSETQTNQTPGSFFDRLLRPGTNQ